LARGEDLLSDPHREPKRWPGAAHGNANALAAVAIDERQSPGAKRPAVELELLACRAAPQDLARVVGNRGFGKRDRCGPGAADGSHICHATITIRFDDHP